MDEAGGRHGDNDFDLMGNTKNETNMEGPSPTKRGRGRPKKSDGPSAAAKPVSNTVAIVSGSMQKVAVDDEELAASAQKEPSGKKGRGRPKKITTQAALAGFASADLAPSPPQSGDEDDLDNLVSAKAAGANGKASTAAKKRGRPKKAEERGQPKKADSDTAGGGISSVTTATAAKRGMKIDSGEDDEDSDAADASPPSPKRGRGRPKKDAGESTAVSSGTVNADTTGNQGGQSTAKRGRGRPKKSEKMASGGMTS